MAVLDNFDHPATAAMPADTLGIVESASLIEEADGAARCADRVAPCRPRQPEDAPTLQASAASRCPFPPLRSRRFFRPASSRRRLLLVGPAMSAIQTPVV